MQRARFRSIEEGTGDELVPFDHARYAAAVLEPMVRRIFSRDPHGSHATSA